MRWVGHTINLKYFAKRAAVFVKLTIKEEPSLMTIKLKHNVNRSVNTDPFYRSLCNSPSVFSLFYDMNGGHTSNKKTTVFLVWHLRP